MIVVIYKNDDDRGVVQIPFKTLRGARFAAKALFDKGCLGVRVSKIDESILYIPEK